MRTQGQDEQAHHGAQGHKHNIGVQWHQCPHCDYKAKTNNQITRHKARKHNIGVQWHQCTHCDYKAKTNGQITVHKASVHNIGVRWKQCTECDFKAKMNGNLNQLIKSHHTSAREARRTGCSPSLSKHREQAQCAVLKK